MHPLLSFLTHYFAACRGQFFDYQVSTVDRGLLQAISHSLHMLSASGASCDMRVLTCPAACCRRVPSALLSSQKRCRSMVSSLRSGMPEAESLDGGNWYSALQPGIIHAGTPLGKRGIGRSPPCTTGNGAFCHAADVWPACASRTKPSARFGASHELALPVLACVSTREASCATALQPLLLLQGSVGSSDCV